MIEKTQTLYKVTNLTVIYKGNDIGTIPCRLELAITADGEPDYVDIQDCDIAKLIESLQSFSLSPETVLE
jgi:hypothetical protein